MATGDILIVEDEHIIAFDLKKELEFLGYRVSGVASCGRDALQLAEGAVPDLVLMDIHLKGNIDGVQVAKEMKNRFNIPVIYLTGFADEHTLSRVKETEPVGYLLKPFNQKEVRAAVELALGSKRGTTLKKRESWFSSVLQGMSDAVVATNSQGTVRYINSAAEALLGWDAGEAIGKPVDTVLLFRDEIMERADGMDWFDVTRHRFGWVQEATIVCKDRVETEVEFTIGPITESDGKESGAVFVLRDPGRRIA